METWETVHDNAEGPGTATLTWRWSSRDRHGRKLRAGHYRAKVIAVQFSLSTPLVDQETLLAWLRER